MTRIAHSTNAPLLERRLLAEADRRGDANGVVTRQELEQVVQALDAHPAYDVDAGRRQSQAHALLARDTDKISATLDPELQKLPQPLRRLALEMDALWGNADGKISVAEFDRVVEYTLAAIPFFTDQAEHLLELARYLGFDRTDSGASASVLQLQVALSRVDRQEVESAKPFRALFDEALKQSEQPGAPEYLRDVLFHSPRWHSFSILEHTTKAVQAGRDLATTIGMDWKEAGATMFLHDVGKILDRGFKHTDEQGVPNFHYFDHEGAGAQWLEQRGLSPDIAFHVRNHAELRNRTAPELIELAGHSPQRMAQMLLVYVADQVAKGDTPDQLASFDQQRPKILELAEYAGIDGQTLLQRADTLRQEIR